ncbi:Eukaryotic peptide chain release factor subunit 1 [Trichinella patagoniensis]|uniref:Eukaryotic peptide chain release factor subunit 1 n=1 Tax=Trichinella patagoniensis TaxID=990121 RepID=A0A0V1A5U4_9BILA|nr:Eukaryotic peptide chain release factor subunit 1 [Trichinella patagoniensis]
MASSGGNGLDDSSADRNVEIWKVKRLIKSLEAARGNGTSMISLIIPPKDQILRASKMLADEYGTASNIKSRVNRLSVLGALTSVQARLKLYNKVPPNGLVIYCGTIVTDEGKEKKVNIDFEPFKPINTSLYQCDNKFHTEALQALLADDNKFGFIVMDGNGALFGTLQGSSREVLLKFTVDLPKKHVCSQFILTRMTLFLTRNTIIVNVVECVVKSRGGQSALRFARLRLEKRHNYVRKVAETAVQMFITNDKVNISGLVLAGSADFKSELGQSDMLDQRLQAKILKIVDVSYGGENGFNQAIELSADALHYVKFIQEKKLISKYFDEISQDTGKYVYGIDDTLRGLEMGAVETLICWENLDIIRYTLRNTQTAGNALLCYCRHASAETEKQHFTDKETGAELELVDSVSMLEWLANNYKSFGAALEIVTDKSQEGAQFVKGFGGIGGILRYRVDFAMHDIEDGIADFDLDDY